MKKVPVPKNLTALTRLILTEIIRQRKFFLIPVWILLVVLVILFAVSGNSFILPAIYMTGF